MQIQLESLDIMGEVLHKFGSLVASQHDKVQSALLPLLANNRIAVRKRTSVAIGIILCFKFNPLKEKRRGVIPTVELWGGESLSELE